MRCANVGRIGVFLGALVLSAFAFASVAGAESIAFIVNAGNPASSMSPAELKRLYENDTVKWPDGKNIVLYDLPVKNDARKKVSTAVLGKEAEEVARDWANKKITNTAKNPPVVVSSGVLVQSRVAEDPGAIGYMPKGDVTNAKVRIIAVID
ncbi:MAG: hypothetical protein AABZ23_05485 [Deltaproteobacteria bacterium]